jgi:hypothetical protein
MAIIGEDIKRLLEDSTEKTIKAFIHEITESVQSDSYLNRVTDEERSLAEECDLDGPEHPAAKKKRRSWGRGEQRRTRRPT